MIIRKMLGKELTYLKLSYEDKKIVLELFDKLPRIIITDKSSLENKKRYGELQLSAY